MSQDSHHADDQFELRRQAEEHLKERHRKNPELPRSEVDVRRLVHELSVHQIELEMQNAELLQSRIDLEEGLERYTELYDFSPLGYLTLAKNAKILDANLTVTTMLGVERSLLKGDRLIRFVEAEDIPVFNAFMDQVFSPSKSGYCEVKLHKNNVQSAASAPEALNKRTVRIDAVVSDNGEQCRAVLTDISMQREIEEENAALQANLVQAQKMESIGRLAGGIAHDFNNMLGVILGHTEIALSRIDPRQALHGDLDAIFKAATRSAELTSQLLAFARKQTVIPKIHELNSTVEPVLTMLRRLIGEDIILDWLPGSRNEQVKIDPIQISQILTNLCVNARDAIIGAGCIAIKTGKIHITKSDCIHGHPCDEPGDYVTLTVADNGIGIDKKDLPYIFEPFFTTKAQGKGTGLGLSMVYGIVKQNFGCIECRSESGKGSTFTIYLPLYDSAITNVESALPHESIKKGKETILVVEDEPAILSLCKLILENGGYSVLALASPSEAIRIATERKDEIQLLLTDVVMPEMNGNELSQKLHSIIPHLKTIFMSGYTADVIASNGVLDEGSNFIQKPFSVKELARTIHEMLKT